MDLNNQKSNETKLLIKNKIIEKVQKKFEEDNWENGEVKKLIKCDHCDVEEIIEKNKILENKYNETFESLNKVRSIVLELSEQILEKEFRITHLEKNLHESEKKIKILKDEINSSNDKLDRLKIEMMYENTILENQINRMSEIVKEKDSKILNMNKENSNFSVEIKELKKKNTELMNQLDVTCDNLSNIVKETNERENMLNNLEAELKKKQVERQGLYLNEINRNKRMYINIKVKENMMSQILKEKNNQILILSKEIKSLREKLEKISNTFNEVSLSNLDRNNKTLAISNSTKSQVQCTVSSPCNMRMVNGTAKITI